MLTQAANPARVKRRSTRDSQRSKLYKAEAVLKPFAKPLPSVKDVERFTRYVWSLGRVQQAFPQIAISGTPKIKDGRGRRRACAFGGHAIAIPLWARDSHIVLHELAHIVTRRKFGAGPPGHGWEFCETYLRLTLYVLGREAHDALKASFKANRVKFRQPRQGKPLTPERRAQLTATLAQARAARAKPAKKKTGYFPHPFPQLDLD